MTSRRAAVNNHPEDDLDDDDLDDDLDDLDDVVEDADLSETEPVDDEEVGDLISALNNDGDVEESSEPAVAAVAAAVSVPDPSRTTYQAALDAAANDEIAKKQRTLRYRLKRNRASYVMLSPYFILFFLFTVLPVLMSIGLSFTYFNMLEFPKFNGWDNYIKSLKDSNLGILDFRAEHLGRPSV